VHDSYSGAHFPVGQQSLSGAQALQFVRQRHGLPNGDLDRERRQQAFLGSAVHQLLSAGTLTNPARLADIITSVQNAVVLDQGWDLLQFAQQLQGIAGADITFATIPIVNITYWTPADGDAVEVDPAQVRQFVAMRFTKPTAVGSSVPTTGAGAAGMSATPTPTSSETAPVTAGDLVCVN
jgi:anionic cell wall polymer biosynthesis LytR-Cps2A-Psr (LCP) family protein